MSHNICARSHVTRELPEEEKTLVNCCLVTGGAGFIGSHLVKNLLERNYTVRVLDNFSTGRDENLAGCSGNLEVIRGDIRDAAKLEQVMRGVSLTYHLAAISSVPLSVDQPAPTFDVNLGGTCNVLEAARANRVKRFVFVSSASVYGAVARVPFRESMQLQGSSPYATSKLIGEQLCNLYMRLYGLEVVALRFFSVYGARQNPQSQYSNVIPAFASRLLRGETPTVYGDGKQTRDFVYVGDIVRGMTEAGRRKGVVGEVINIGTGKQTSVLQLLAHIQKTLGTDIPHQFSPRKPGDDPRTCADPGKAIRLLGFKRFTPLDKGLALTLSWYKSTFTPALVRQ